MLLIASGGRRSAGYFADSVAGSDANSGTSPSAPKQSLAGVPWASNLTVALKYGSTWYESLDLSSYTGIRLETYGTPSDGLPVIDGTAVFASWSSAADQIRDRAGNTILDRAGSVLQTRAAFWEASISHDASATNRLTIYEDDALLARQSSNSALAGVFSAFLDIKGSDGSPLTARIHAAANGNPNTNGKTYRVTVRNIALKLGDNSEAVGIRAQRAISNNGAIEVGLNARLSRVLSNYGTKHNLLIGSGYLHDCVAVRADPVTSYELSNTSIVWFTDDASGKSLHIARLFSLRDGYGDSVPFIAHDNQGHNFTSMTGQQLAAVDQNFAYSLGSPLCVVDALFSKNALSPIATVCNDLTLRYAQTQAGSGTTGIIPQPLTSAATQRIQDSVFYDTGSNDGLWRFRSAFNGCTLELDRSVLYHAGARPSFTDEGMTSGTIKLRNSIVVAVGGNVRIVIPSGVTYVGDYNVFAKGGDSGLSLTYHGATYTTLASWQAATGQDANSIVVDAADLSGLFSGTVANGDFRLGASGAGAQADAIDAGPQNHFNWNSGLTSGPPTAWPDVPETLAEAETYVRNPGAWVF